MSVYSNLYNTPLEVGISTPWFHGCEQGPQYGRSCIETAKGVFYAAVYVGEDRVKIVKSVDRGFSWVVVRVYPNRVQGTGVTAGGNGVSLYLEYSEVDEVLYVIFIDSVPSGEHVGDLCPFLYDVTNGTAIGFIGGAGAIVCKGAKFACAGHVDRKLALVFADDDVSNTVKVELVDINHYNAGVRDMVLAGGAGRISTASLANGGPDDTQPLGLYDVSEVDGGFWLWWVNTVGQLVRKEITLGDAVETPGSNANVLVLAPTGDYVITELFGCEDSVLFSYIDTVTAANNLMMFFSVTRGVVGNVSLKNGDAALAEDPGGTYSFYTWPQVAHINDAGVVKFQLFFMGRNAGDTANELETVALKQSDGTRDTVQIVTGSLAGPWALRDKCYRFFEAPDRVQGEIGGRAGFLVGVGNGTAEGHGHRTGNASVYTEWLANNAYPLAIASSVISSGASNYHAAGDKGREEMDAARVFALHGIPMVILKYEVATDPGMRSQLGYVTPTEIEFNGLINELSLKNPTNIRLEDSEVFADVREKDIRTLYYPANTFLERTFRRARRGFVMRTVYLLKFYGRFYEVTQIVPVFGNSGIVANKANLYAVGGSYDPFTRVVLPNET